VVPFVLEPLGLGAFALYAQLTGSIRTLQNTLSLTEEDTDELKEMISGSNLKWWALTTLVSMLHALFSYLAFSNDGACAHARSCMCACDADACVCGFVDGLLLVCVCVAQWVSGAARQAWRGCPCAPSSHPSSARHARTHTICAHHPHTHHHHP
jgi:uncharacterized protein (DUF779 family)